MSAIALQLCCIVFPVYDIGFDPFEYILEAARVILSGWAIGDLGLS